MNRDPVLFRVDGMTQTGWERLNRCLTYAMALQRRRRPTFFLSRLEPASLAFNIKRAGNEWLEADAPVGTEEDLCETIQEIRRIRPAAVVVDDPDVTEDYLNELVSIGALVLSLDSLANITFPSQIVVNPLLGPGREAYEVYPGTQLLLGARYALVRPEVRRVRPLRAQEPAQPSATTYRALLAMGDDDPNRQTVKLVQQLLAIGKLEKLDVVARPHHPEFDQLQALAASQEARLEVVSEPADVGQRIGRCHFALTSGNAWSIELACVGVPQLIIVQQEVHWPTAQRLEDEGAAMCLGSHENVSAATIRNAILNLLSEPLERQSMARCARQLIDGRGPDRLVTALEVMLHPSRYVDADLREAA
jgi:spore coat polysaccharide biosynthesis predicted glycosyltransferase SpsG